MSKLRKRNCARKRALFSRMDYELSTSINMTYYNNFTMCEKDLILHYRNWNEMAIIVVYCQQRITGSSIKFMNFIQQTS